MCVFFFVSVSRVAPQLELGSIRISFGPNLFMRTLSKKTKNFVSFCEKSNPKTFGFYHIARGEFKTHTGEKSFYPGRYPKNICRQKTGATFQTFRTPSIDFRDSKKVEI